MSIDTTRPMSIITGPDGKPVYVTIDGLQVKDNVLEAILIDLVRQTAAVRLGIEILLSFNSPKRAEKFDLLNPENSQLS